MDPRRILEKAAEQRQACEILPRKGGWTRGSLLRIDRAGVVVLIPDLRLASGEDVRCWFVLDGIPYTFEASIIRTHLPVPDRSQIGYLLGFIDEWTRGDSASNGEHGIDIKIFPPNGPGISLVHGPGRIMELLLNNIGFTLPTAYTLVFIEGSKCKLKFIMPGEDSIEVEGKIVSRTPSESHSLYHLTIEGVERIESYRRVNSALQKALEN